MEGAMIVHIEASMGLIADLLVETQRALVETFSESVYQNLVTQLRVEEGHLRELYKRQSVKLEPGLDARIRHTLGEAMRTSTLLYNRIDRVKVTTTGNVSIPKLKPLPLLMFEGEVQEYALFRELFTIHVDRRADLDDVSKFRYLLWTLCRDPLRIVKSLSVTAANYRIALDLLDKQYCNVHQTLVNLHKKLANIFVPSLDPVELRRFRFELTIIINQIKRLSSNDIGHGMVMSLINQRLSEGKLYRKVVEHLRKCDYALDEFFGAIDFIIRMLEDEFLQQGDKLEPDKKIDVSHPPRGCRRVTDVAARHRILLERGLCLNCTNSGHRSDKRPIPNSCKNCSGNHNTHICDNYNPGKRLQSVPSTSAPSNGSSQSTTSSPVVNATPRQHEPAPCPSKEKVVIKQCKSGKIARMSNVDLPCTILPTAMAEINHKQGSKRVRLFLDTGSQKSFISAKTARQLGLPVVGKVALNIAPFGSAEISGQYDVVSCRIEIGRRVVQMKLVAHENVDVPIHNAGYVQFDVDEWWRLDRIGITPSEQYTVREVEAMRKVSQTVVKKPEGYQVSLPFGSDARPDTNYRNAVAQLESLQTKFRKDRECFDQYQRVINNYLEAGFISEVKEPKIEGYYMPHLGIRKIAAQHPSESCLMPQQNLKVIYH
ncbi:uncharacterized protein [Palaemon carinicauda]|uniref:uncharacterized protein n=1 Tax=Palaemon carinicauda TaxID=392227 RepID=UPI0035B66E17